MTMHSYQYPEPLAELIELWQSLPGVGKRTAERMIFALMKWPPEKIACLGELLTNLPRNIGNCPECGNLAGKQELCPVCASDSRDDAVICVVEEPPQIIAIENSSGYRGRYHVLHGKLAPLNGVNAEDLNIASLVSRVEKGTVKEVILALSPDVEGQATGAYVAELIKDKGVTITRLAQGLPAGSDISYADAATIAAALNGRTTL